MGDVDEYQTQEEAKAQRAEAKRRERAEADATELRAAPVKGTALKLRRTHALAIERVHPGENIRTDLPDIHDLACSIREVGLLTPLLVRPWDASAEVDGDLPAHAPAGGDHYRLVAGHRRHAALTALREAGVEGFDEAQCEVREGLTEAEAYALMLTENVQRVPLEPVQAARALRLLLDLNEGMDASTLARSLGLKPAWAQTHLKLLDLPQELIDRIEAGDLSVTIADLLRKGQATGRLSEREMLDLARRAATKEISGREIREAAGPKRPATEAPRTLKVGPDGRPIEPPTPLREGNWTPGLSESYDAPARPATPLGTGSPGVPGVEATRARDAAAGVDNSGASVPVAPGGAIPLEVKLDIYLLGRALREWADDDYLDALGIDRTMTEQYAAALDFEERIGAIRRLSNVLMDAERVPG